MASSHWVEATIEAPTDIPITSSDDTPRSVRIKGTLRLENTGRRVYELKLSAETNQLT